MRGCRERHCRRAVLLAIPLVALAGAPADARYETAPDPSPPEGVDADIVARGVVEFPAGTFHWRILESSLVAGDPPTPAPEPAALLLVKSGTVDVDGSSSFHLSVGEAAMFAALPRASVSTTAADGASFWMLQIYDVSNSGGPGATGGPFTVSQGPREVRLLRHVLVAGDESPIAGDSDLPILVLATDRTIHVSSSEGGDPTELAAGESSTFDGALTVITTEDTATFVAAMVGPPIDGQVVTTAAETSSNGPAPPESPGAVEGSRSQTIDFPPPGESHQWPDSTVVLQATASSGLPVSYRISENPGGVCELEGATLSASQPGGCTIEASQPGVPGRVDAAPTVSRDFYVGVTRLTTPISVPGPTSASETPQVDVTVVVSSQTGAQSFEADLNVEASGDCTLSEGFAGVTGPGTHTFTVALTAPPAGEGVCTITARASGRYAIGDPHTVSFVVTA